MMGDEMAEAWAGGYREGTSCWATAELMRELRCQVARGRSQIECTQEQLVVVMGYLYFLAGEIWQVLKYRRGRAVTEDTTRAHTPAAPPPPPPPGASSPMAPPLAPGGTSIGGDSSGGVGCGGGRGGGRGSGSGGRRRWRRWVCSDGIRDGIQPYSEVDAGVAMEGRAGGHGLWPGRQSERSLSESVWRVTESVYTFYRRAHVL